MVDSSRIEDHHTRQSGATPSYEGSGSRTSGGSGSSGAVKRVFRYSSMAEVPYSNPPEKYSAKGPHNNDDGESTPTTGDLTPMFWSPQPPRSTISRESFGTRTPNVVTTQPLNLDADDESTLASLSPFDANFPARRIGRRSDISVATSVSSISCSIPAFNYSPPGRDSRDHMLRSPRSPYEREREEDRLTSWAPAGLRHGVGGSGDTVVGRFQVQPPLVSSPSGKSQKSQGGKSHGGKSAASARIPSSTESLKSSKSSKSKRRSFRSRRRLSRGKASGEAAVVLEVDDSFDTQDALFNKSDRARSDSGVDEASAYACSEAPSLEPGEDNSSHNDERKNVARSESDSIKFFRIMVTVVLLCGALSASMGVYFYFDSTETSAFERAFESDTNHLFHTIGISMKHTLEAVDGFTLSLVSQVPKQDWPFVTIPGFHRKAGRVIELSKVRSVNLNMVVQPAQKSQWESWAFQNMGWFNESLISLPVDEEEEYSYDENLNGTLYSGGYAIWGENSNELAYKPFYLPLWQHEPVDAQRDLPPEERKVYNEDILQSRDGDAVNDLITVFDQRQAVIGAFKSDKDVEDGDLLSIISYPVIVPEFLNNPTDYTSGVIVGVVRLSLHWRDVLRDILPPLSRNILAVLSDTCSERVHTYRIDGPNVIDKGVGDLQERNTEYRDMSVTSDVIDLIMASNAEDDGYDAYQGLPIGYDSYEGLPIANLCTQTITFYPTEANHKEFTTLNALYFSILSVVIFVFVFTVFLFYDTLVIKRQRAVVKHVDLLTGIVSNLFPSAVREQLYEDQEGVDGKFNQRHGDGAVIKAILKGEGDTELDDLVDASYSGDDDVTIGFHNTKPMADLFEETTVMFGK